MPKKNQKRLFVMALLSGFILQSCAARTAGNFADTKAFDKAKSYWAQIGRSAARGSASDVPPSRRSMLKQRIFDTLSV
jgi:hypothetical protein